MKLQSKIQELETIRFPEYQGDQCYMEKIDPTILDLGPYSRWRDPVMQAFSWVPFIRGISYLTIDEKEIKAGRSHRRGGPHTDGNYVYGWGQGQGWMTGENGRILPRAMHLEQYCSEGGGMLIASTKQGCRAWTGEYSGEPNQGGDCSHIDLSGMDSFLLKPNTLYVANSTCIHESIPFGQDTKRSLIRITLPATAKVL